MIFSETLEFDTFKEYLKSHFASTFACEYLDSLKPLQNEREILTIQSYFREIFNILSVKSELKLPIDAKYSDFFKRLKDPYAVFMPEDFIIFRNFHSEVNSFKKDILECEQVNQLKNITSNIHSFSDLTTYIAEKITDDAKVKDNASDELFNIREKLRGVRKSLISSINNVFSRSDADKFIQERVVKEYNNRYVLLCKTNFRQYISGIVHSTSSSGQTVYVEPNFLIDINNQYQDLVVKEEIEVRKILKGILDRIKSNIYEIVETVKSYSKLAFMFSVAQVYIKYTYCIPEISDEIIFEDIYHPLILFSKDNDAVPISLEMKKNTNLIIITGPNTGGKTATLKTVGLNTIIAKCGLPLFGRYAKVLNFKNILADIGDNQSLIMSLSTFSSHILNIKKILEIADSNSLALLDEVGTGTEPTEGAALALGTIKVLLEKLSKVIVTTHFSDIKTFGLKRDDCEIYSVDFDYKSFESSYKLLKGVVGKSSPIIIARKLKFDEKAIQYAESYLNEKISDRDRMFEELNLLKAEIEREKLKLNEKENLLIKKENEILAREMELKEKLELKEMKLLEETYLLLNRAKSVSENVNKFKNDKKFVEENIDKVKERLDKLKDKKSIKDEIKVGDNIFLEKYNKIANILEIKKDNILVDLQGIKVTLKKNEIIGKKIKPEMGKNVKIKKDVTSSAKMEIVVIGKTVEEAVEEIEKVIDKALLDNLSSIYIVHGRGTGALRKGIHEYLKTNPHIKSFRIGDNTEGGQAVTIVSL